MSNIIFPKDVPRVLKATVDYDNNVATLMLDAHDFKAGEMVDIDHLEARITGKVFWVGGPYIKVKMKNVFEKEL